MNAELTLAWRNLWRRKRRTWLTVGAMAFCNAILVFAITLQYGTYAAMVSNTLSIQSSHLQVLAEGYHDEPEIRSAVPDGLALAQRIRAAFPDYDVAVRAESFVLAATDERSNGVMIAGVEPANERRVSVVPAAVSEGSYLSSTGQIALGEALARNLAVDVGSELVMLGSGYDGSIAAGLADVGGKFDSGFAELDRSLVQIPLADFDSMFAMEGRVHRILINVPHIDMAAEAKIAVDELLADEAGLEVLTWEELNPGLKQTIQSDIVSNWIVYCILIVLVVFNVLNTQLMSVLERIREFGIMQAVGMSSRRLIGLVMLETGLLAGLGLLVGLAIGFAIAVYCNVYGFAVPGMEEMHVRFNMPERMYSTLSPFAVVLGPAVVFACSLLGAVYPALKLRGLQPVQAMRKA